MKIYTNENNTLTLKLLIAANLAGKKVEIKTASLGDGIFAGPRQLPLLEVDEELTFFSSNAAAQYLFPVLDLSENGQCQQMQEWEATRLHPCIQSVVAAKAPPADLKQLLTSLLQDIDNILANKIYILGDKLSAADISIWSTLYPVYYGDIKSQYLNNSKNIARWMEDIAGAKAIQEAVKQWGGSANGPFGAFSVLGVPQVQCLGSSTGSPEAPVEQGPTPEEIEKAKDCWANAHERLQPPHKQEKVILPVKGRKNILITSALPYVNNVPHLGNIIGCVLSADIFARYCRICDYNALFVCGTDEYGTATENKALEEKLTPREICDKYYQIHNDVYRWFNIGFDYFGRTSTPEQTEITQKVFMKLYENGFITKQSVDQLLCKKCDRFLADRFVEGTCPHPGCGYEGARGDQCDKCGKLVTATELLAPRCKQCAQPPELAASDQMFLDLAQLEPAVRAWAGAAAAGWAAPARAVARAWLREGLRARCITRDLRWGVPVPLADYRHKVFYVWFDAPIGYMSITQCCTKQYEKWWKPDKEHNVKLYQFMAKDNVPFHSVMFPAVLIGANEGWLMVDHIYATEYLNYEEGKFSKSRGVGVFGTDAQETGIPSDVWRFYLASIRPESSDSSFSWVELGTRNNSELLNNLGNFCHRSLSFCANFFDGKVPELKPRPSDYELMALINREVVEYARQMERGRLREALRLVLAVARRGNQHMQAERPWVLVKGEPEDRERGATAIGLCCQIVALLCTLIAPYMPETTIKLCNQLNIDRSTLRLNSESPSLCRRLPAGHRLGPPEPLFCKLEAERLEGLRARYAGTQGERAAKENGAAATLGANASVAELEAAIVEQGDKVRRLKASTKDKTVWQPEVALLLELKKRLAQTQPSADTAEALEKAISEQGDVVRRLKASSKDKAVWTPAVNVLLDLKKRLAALNIK